ncbi:EBS1 Protein EBS1 [Candida maltosa Xu316]
MANTDEIQLYKSQLDDFLQRKFIDQSLLIGFNASLQAKFHSWIVNDLTHYQENLDTAFTTIHFFEILWTEFHSPVIKFFQHQHAKVLEELNNDFKACQKEGRPGDFKVKPVEMRKINDNFIKFIKEIFMFYSKLLKYFVTRYENAYVPNKFLNHFNYKVSERAISCSDENFQANVLYLDHKCCLSLGDILRHQAFVETSFVNPSSSNREFFKHKSLGDSHNFLTAYSKSIQYYEFCIMLLPALNEPYNHIVDDKFNAIYWFLRSQYTRIPEYKLGFSNLTKILSKHWFTTALVDIVNASPERRFTKEQELNVYLICLIGYIYCPERYKNGPNIVKKIPFSKIETELFKSLASNYEQDMVLKQLTVLFSFVKLTSGDEYEKLARFAFRYVERVLDYMRKNNPSSLVVLRFILNVLRENKELLDIFHSRRNCVMYLTAVLNNYLTDSFIDSRPTRKYYFWEDVHFRDCSLIKFQFKDFKDDGIFEENDINHLVGDYSDIDFSNVLSDNQTIEDYENDLRTSAILVLGKKLLTTCKEYEFQYDKDAIKFSMKKKQPQIKQNENLVTKPARVEEEKVIVPTSMEEIESIISEQRSKLRLEVDQGYENMVNKIVDEPEVNLQQQQQQQQPIVKNIWEQNQQQIPQQPVFLNPQYNPPQNFYTNDYSQYRT